MTDATTENFLSRTLAITGAITTVFLVSDAVTDPVNTPKLVVLGVFSSVAFAILISDKHIQILRKHKFLVATIIFFVFWMVISSIVSPAPLTQVLYGSYGRNTGVLTYIFLSIALISTLALNSIRSLQNIVNGLMIAGVINLGYGLWVIIFGDFVAWNNPYKSILGTFGNPNFIGAFLGIIFSALFAIVLDHETGRVRRILAGVALPICIIQILDSNAIQGRVVAIFGSAIVLFLYVRSRFAKWVVFVYSISILIAGAFALAGALQIGPLTKIIYKTSVSLRGQYWIAGWNTGESNPLFGAGMDSFGDWYRRMRDIRALELPGVNTVVNAAHNVPIDIFAFGGWPLFLSYLMILILTGLSLIKIIRRQAKFESTWAILISGWAGYQLQSLISINQIGLAVWGWLLGGAIIAYERVTRSVELNKQLETRKKDKRIAQLNPRVPLVALAGGLIGLFAALPPLNADVKWRSAMKSQSLPDLEKSLVISYLNPPNSMKFLQSIQSLEQSGLHELSRKYALEAVSWNPDVFDFWKFLYLIKNSSVEEKELAVLNMKRLDPLNPDVISVP